MTINNKIKELVKSTEKEIIAWRRHLHRNPELSFEEYKTADYVEAVLKSFNTDMKIYRPTKTSIVAILKTAKKGKVVGVRADMDALPIKEESGVEFASTNDGVMHACGHDAHTAMLLGVVKILNALKDELSGEYHFIFQHAEEVLPGGASEMIAAKALDGLDYVIGAHIWSLLPTGEIHIKDGTLMASADTVTVKINGKGSHGAEPHNGIDTILIGSQLVVALQSIVSRNINPLDNAVITVGKFHAGTAENIIPTTAELGLTVRAFTPQTRDFLEKRIREVVNNLCAAFGATADIIYTRGYSPVINNEFVAEAIKSTAIEAFGENMVKKAVPMMGAEDFSAMANMVDGCFVLIGAANPSKHPIYPHHNSKFAIDEDAFKVGAELLAKSAIRLGRADF